MSSTSLRRRTGGQLVARVAAGLEELSDDIVERRHADGTLLRDLCRAHGLHAGGKLAYGTGGDVVKRV